ncbi:MAG: amidohydrolase, partial [Candidatus Dormibacteraeota bacterium]|nr:amidohydrolase [Candidatus Dormibacteraeota bacterium]
MQAAAAKGWVGFKTIAAYRTGLRIDPEATAAGADRELLGQHAAGLPVRRRGHLCRSHVLRRALGVAADLRRPMQIHTGFGDSEIRLQEAHPLLLDAVLRTPEGEAASIVLIHGSYPWHEELAYLAATRPNVWADLSLFNIFAPALVGERMLRVLELAPAARVLLGTDGHGQPETHWFG